MSARVIHGDCLDVMRAMAERGETVTSIVTDPPYGLEFMGRGWDHAVPGVPFWQAAYALLPPGGHLLAFGGTRTFHRLAVAIEDAGFELRDTLQWIYGTGFPKSLDVSKAIDKAAGAVREVVGPNPWNHVRNHNPETWQGATRTSAGKYGSTGSGPSDITAPATDAALQWAGYGTALKPAWEPIILARKPLAGTVAANVLAHGVGALNIDGCRVGWQSEADKAAGRPASMSKAHAGMDGRTFAIADRSHRDPVAEQRSAGRWPANVVHDGSEEVEAAFAAFGSKGGGFGVRGGNRSMAFGMGAGGVVGFGDAGSASRFFYCAKASKADRAGSKHPTIKPVALKRWLVRMVTPPGGVVLDPFAGSGTTLAAALAEGCRAIGIEQAAEYVADIHARLARDAAA